MVGGDPERTASVCVFQPSWSHSGTVSSFRLDTFEVTVARFRKFVEAMTSAWKPAVGAGAHPKIADSGWHSEWDSTLPTTREEWNTRLSAGIYQTWTPEVGSKENQPISVLTWFEAFAFCVWDGGRLPTELEWEYAAAGGAENRAYPWGSATPTQSLAAFGCTNSCSSVRIENVGSKWLGKGRWGQQDMAGNMGEWVLDLYDFNLVAHKGVEECNDCATLGPVRAPGQTQRTTRGGYPAGTMTDICATRRFGLPDNYRGTFHTGVRCARDP